MTTASTMITAHTNSDHKEHKHKHSMPNHTQMMEWDMSGVLHQDNLEALGLLPV